MPNLGKAISLHLVRGDFFIRKGYIVLSFILQYSE